MPSQPLRLATLVAMSLVVTALTSPASAAEDALTNAQYDTLKKIVVPAYHDGASFVVIKNLSPLLAKMKPAAMREADALLERRGVPPVDKLLADSRLALVRQGMGRKMPKTNKAEAVLVLPVLHARVVKMYKAAKAHPAWTNPAADAASLKEYNKLLDGIDVLGNQLESARGLAQYAAQMSKLVSRLKPDRFAESQRKAMAFNFAAAEKILEGLRQQLYERVIELRILRLSRASDLLEKSADGKVRYEAAYAVGLDKQFLDLFFRSIGKHSRGKFTRPALNEPGLEKKVTETFERAEKSAGDLLVKSRLLFDGLDWWMRGRYGSGPHWFGLLKSAAAIDNPRAREALYMPGQTPRPIAPAGPNGKSIPVYDRRHHYTWAWQNRTAGSGPLVRVSRELVSQTHSEVFHQAATFYSPGGCGSSEYWYRTDQFIVRTDTSTYRDTYRPLLRLPKTVSKYVHRLVGFYEYQNALARFDALLARATEDDLKAIDGIIEERKELAIYTNLSRRVQKGPSTLIEKPRKPKDNFNRTGLAWIMALARVEVAAMVAGFTTTSKPFEKVKPSRLELPAYQEMLWDGLRMHYGALAADPQLKQVTTGRLTMPQLLTYARRLLVARKFHVAVKQFAAAGLTVDQQAELKTWERNLRKLHGKIWSRIEGRLGLMSAPEAAEWTRTNREIIPVP